ncbi:hypothetical protein ABEY55_07960 [Priestia aryabhattai]|uniref:hypothetical protein n=1 Tax=Priestia aryabhattai TaxID=412384 RepID=UPI003D2AFA73
MEMKFSQTNCFLCGLDISENVTEEHIFPKWLQRKYNLWDQTITLLNGTLLPYRRIKIPCCSTCNGEYLSQLEERVSKAVEMGYEGFIKLDQDDIFYWSAKLMYGMFFKELSLNVDRRNPSLGTITTPEIMRRFNSLHTLLQGIRIKTEFLQAKPYSLFIYKVKEDEDPKNNFDYADSYEQQVYSMILGDIGFVICFEDASMNREYGENFFGKFEDKLLHPIQLQEIYARIMFHQTYANFVPKYVIIGDDNSRIIMVNVPYGKVFLDGPIENLAKILSGVWRKYNLKFEDIYVPPDLTISYLQDSSGNFHDIPMGVGFKSSFSKN